MKFSVLIAILALTLAGCLPKDSVQLREVKNVVVIPGTDPILTGDAVFFNPNKTRMRLRKINVDIYVDGKKNATVNHDLKITARPNAEFTIPLKVQLSLKDMGLVETLRSLFGGKKYEIHYLGHLKVNVNGFPMRIPIDHKEDFSMGF
jgi:LEA14-like dessication related protein